MNQDPARRMRLETWKEIGAYLGRNERTAKRWEVERGLPVRRVPGGGRTQVYAFTDELAAWLGHASPDAIPQAVPEVPQPDPPTAPPVPSPVEPPPRRRRFLAAAGVLASALLLAPAAAWWWSARHTEAASAHASPSAGETDLTLQGEYYFNKRTPEALQTAQALFEQAVKKSPRDAHAYVGLSKTYNLMREFTLMPAAEAYPKALAAAERAIQLDDGIADAHSTLGFVRFYYLRDVEGADAAFRRAMQLDPASAQAHHWRATYLLHLSRFAEALDEVEKARTLAPTSRAILADRGIILYFVGRDGEAVQALESLAAAEPDFRSPQQYLAEIHLARGDDREYLEAARRASQLLHDPVGMADDAAATAAYESGGRAAMLETLLRRRLARYREGRLGAYEPAEMLAYLGRDSDALAMLEAAMRTKEPSLVEILSNPAFRKLHDQSRFKRLAREWGFPSG